MWFVCDKVGQWIIILIYYTICDMVHPPFKKILVAINGSFHASIAARYSFILAEAFNAKLFIGTVFTKKMVYKEEKAATLSVEKVLDEAREIGLDVEGVLLTGDVVEAINKFVRDNKIELVVASTRKPHREKRFFIRSITSGLMSRLPCNIIGMKITHPGRSIRPKKVLIPVIGDGFRDKERADIAEAIASKFDSRITAFHVVELTDLQTRRMDKVEKDRLIMSAERRIASFTEEIEGRRINVTEKIVIGRSAREEIISEASHQKYDLIIVGTTMRNIIRRVVSGSPVEEVLRDTPCDVMLVHFR